MDRAAPTGRDTDPAVARFVAELVSPGMTLGISAGALAPTVAEQLRAVPSLTVVTNSVAVAGVLWRAESRTEVILTGGTRDATDALTGPVTLETLGRLRLDTAIVEPWGIGPRDGFTARSLGDGEVLEGFARSARNTIVVGTTSASLRTGIAGLEFDREHTTLVQDDRAEPLDGADRRVRQVLLVPSEATVDSTPHVDPRQSGQRRKDIILAALRRDGFTAIAALAAATGASDMTVRRDLQLLEAGGAIRRVRGGAVAVPGASVPTRRAVRVG